MGISKDENIQNLSQEFKKTMKPDRRFCTTFQRRLLQWYHKNKRDLPWRNTTDPYKIWVSEVMLQQTQVSTVLPYYARFLALFPTIQTLAQAPLQSVLKAWEGLGYYARARNLHAAARQIVAEKQALLPGNYDELLRIKGIGDYTAAAVASIAFHAPHPVVDGNVIRVLSRVFRIEEVPAVYGKQAYAEIAEQLLCKKHPGDFNQAMMELGAIICTAQNPSCEICPLRKQCLAHRFLDDPARLPLKATRKEIPHFDVVVGVIWESGRILIRRRPSEGLLGGLWEFPGGRMNGTPAKDAALKDVLLHRFRIHIDAPALLTTVRHAYSHFKITLHAFQCRLADGTNRRQSKADLRWVAPENLREFPFSGANKKVLDHLLESL